MKTIKQTIFGAALLALAGFVFSSTAMTSSAQTKSNDSVEATLIALEKQAFEALKNKDAKFVQDYLSDNFQTVTNSGIGTKADVARTFRVGECTVNSVSLDNFKLTMPNKETALLTYKITKDIVCGGNQIPNAWASSVFVKSGEKWLKVFHQETSSNVQ